MYIIKKHYEATENNPNFAGNIMDYFYGKGSHLLGINTPPKSWEIESYAQPQISAGRELLRSRESI